MGDLFSTELDLLVAFLSFSVPFCHLTKSDLFIVCSPRYAIVLCTEGCQSVSTRLDMDVKVARRVPQDPAFMPREHAIMGSCMDADD